MFENPINSREKEVNFKKKKNNFAFKQHTVCNIYIHGSWQILQAITESSF